MRKLNLSDYEQQLKWFALVLGIFGVISIVLNLYPLSMFLGLPFSIIWIYCSWLHHELQLKYVNIMFVALYVFGIGRYFLA
ncbi:MAG: peptidase [Paracoccaceae bacterium]